MSDATQTEPEGPFAATPREELERQVMDPNVPKMEREWWAADEIARLRAEVERLCKSRNRWGQKYNKLLGKHKAVRTELANQIQWVRDLADNLIVEETKTAALRAEIERLKAANNKLTRLCDPMLSSADLRAVDRHCDWVAFGHAYRAMLNARAALGDTP